MSSLFKKILYLVKDYINNNAYKIVANAYIHIKLFQKLAYLP